MHIKPDNGFVLSDMDKAQLGQSFSAITGQLVAVGIPLAQAVTMAKKFVPSAEVDDNLMQELSAGIAEGMDEGLWNILQQGRDQTPEAMA